MSLLVKIEDLFTEAAGDGNVKELVSLLEQGARINDTDKEGYAALQVAAKKGRDECVTFLLQEGADVNQRDSDGFSALHEAAFWGHDNVARILLRHGADKTFVNSAQQHWTWRFGMATGLSRTCSLKAIQSSAGFISMLYE
ncbi:hypothetical protein PF011_g444 [Phytophthora fragariae]|uniref:Uncharacterized protein n=1 Tax=Phytophthora fragariae TaxID=53985 RepID=A0A6A3MGZ2_9STRA|nr:hypothetical protein PF011_g444 [Phytophthora fragariae]